ncbi:L-2-hydroxyglutarate oxidase [Yinghuangia sp. ASG 101]|uniref:L-2-hydroxyglutarate oxidase n=1 Tax=Yinghuangia sp. ASG 101 TaxID=2896848 RepID=UPI001E4D4E88|nr:L-2-hydroxyglutarate oxidase [Yinghuangia sp. ASG 101]UGQ14946.1 L-2-hydroxyglutarate oxidase [Yinghuangia sp. ASG 101]
MLRYDVIVIGGGIVGLSTAYALTERSPGTTVAVCEKETSWAAHQTGRNSGVIHSGLYYTPGSLKARFAVEGARRMVAFCAEHGIEHEVTGKLVVATDPSELDRLKELSRRGEANGVPVRELTPDHIREYEPNIRAIAGLHVGTTGIVDYAAVCRTLVNLLHKRGVSLRTGAGVTGLAVHPREVVVQTRLGEVRGRVVVNCAGLYSDRVAAMAAEAEGGAPPPVRIVPFRGEYHELAPHRRGLVRGLVYPVPDPAFPFLGVHLTRGIRGDVHVGPNAVLALRREGYAWRQADARELAATLAYPGMWRVARRHWRYGAGEVMRSLAKPAFTRAVQRMLPAVTADDLVRAPAGVRAQAVRPDGELVDDFLFTGGERVVNVLNAPSPAATASLPIGEEIADRVLERLAPTP